MRPGDSVTADSPVVRQFKDLLDQMTIKCTEDRVALAAAIVAANDRLTARGIAGSALTLLAQANATVSADPRAALPMSCTGRSIASPRGSAASENTLVRRSGPGPSVPTYYVGRSRSGVNQSAHRAIPKTR
jgi:hypothetical protein